MQFHSALRCAISGTPCVYINLGTAVDVCRFTASMRNMFFNATKNNPHIKAARQACPVLSVSTAVAECVNYALPCLVVLRTLLEITL